MMTLEVQKLIEVGVVAGVVVAVAVVAIAAGHTARAGKVVHTVGVVETVESHYHCVAAAVAAGVIAAGEL